MKQRFSTFDVRCMVTELREKLLNARLDNIYSIDSKTYQWKFLIHAQKWKEKSSDDLHELSKDSAMERKPQSSRIRAHVVIESGVRFHLVQKPLNSDAPLNGFAKKLRKHLRRKKLVDIQQLGIDRIVLFTFQGSPKVPPPKSTQNRRIGHSRHKHVEKMSNEATTEKFHVICEMYAAGNIILTNSSFSILALLRTVTLHLPSTSLQPGYSPTNTQVAGMIGEAKVHNPMKESLSKIPLTNGNDQDTQEKKDLDEANALCTPLDGLSVKMDVIKSVKKPLSGFTLPKDATTVKNSDSCTDMFTTAVGETYPLEAIVHPIVPVTFSFLKTLLCQAKDQPVNACSQGKEGKMSSSVNQKEGRSSRRMGTSSRSANLSLLPLLVRSLNHGHALLEHCLVEHGINIHLNVLTQLDGDSIQKVCDKCLAYDQVCRWNFLQKWTSQSHAIHPLVSKSMDIPCSSPCTGHKDKILESPNDCIYPVDERCFSYQLSHNVRSLYQALMDADDLLFKPPENQRRSYITTRTVSRIPIKPLQGMAQIVDQSTTSSEEEVLYDEFSAMLFRNAKTSQDDHCARRSTGSPELAKNSDGVPSHVLVFESFSACVEEFFSKRAHVECHQIQMQQEKIYHQKLDHVGQDIQDRLDSLQESIRNWQECALLIENHVEYTERVLEKVRTYLVEKDHSWEHLREFVIRLHRTYKDPIPTWEPSRMDNDQSIWLAIVDIHPQERMISITFPSKEEGTFESGFSTNHASQTEIERSHQIHPQKTLVRVSVELSAYANVSMYYGRCRQAQIKWDKTQEASTHAMESAQRHLAKECLRYLKHHKSGRKARSDVDTSCLLFVDSNSRLSGEQTLPLVHTSHGQKVSKTNLETLDRVQMWFEKFAWFVSSDGFLVLVGHDRQQNEMLVKRYMYKRANHPFEDIYVHADTHGAASVLIKTDSHESWGKQFFNENNVIARKTDTDIRFQRDLVPFTYSHPDRESLSEKVESFPVEEASNGGLSVTAFPSTLLEAASFAVCMSQAWDQNLPSSAYWVYGHQVSKTAPTGEYLGSGSFMIRGKKNYMTSTPLILGLALMFRLREHCPQTTMEEDSRSADSTSDSSTWESSTLSGAEDRSIDEQMTIDLPLKDNEGNDHVSNRTYETKPSSSVRVAHESDMSDDDSLSETEIRTAQTIRNDHRYPELRMLTGRIHECIQQSIQHSLQTHPAEYPNIPSAVGNKPMLSFTKSKLPVVLDSPDQILSAVCVCAPYHAIQHYDYKVKLTPGTMKKNQAIEFVKKLFMHEHDQKSRDLLHEIKVSRPVHVQNKSKDLQKSSSQPKKVNSSYHKSLTEEDFSNLSNQHIHSSVQTLLARVEECIRSIPEQEWITRIKNHVKLSAPSYNEMRQKEKQQRRSCKSRMAL